jgi:putative ABC transport system permease protein
MTPDRWLRIVRLRFRTLFRRRAVEQELDEELQYHVERQTAENVRQGMPSAIARTAALRSLGGMEFRKEQVRDTRGTRWLEDTWRDVTLAWRSLRRSQGFAMTVVLTLALGVGANTAMFTVLRGTLLKPLPNRDGSRLVYLRQSAAGKGESNIEFSVPEIADYRTASHTLAQIAEYSSMTFTLVGADGVPMHVRAGIVSGNYFDVMGLAAVAGRVTNHRDDGPAATPVAVLSYPYWMAHFGGDRDVVGRTLRINDQVCVVVGVVQPAPIYPQPTDVFVNMVTSPHHLSATMLTNRAHRMTEVFARLAASATVEQAREEIGRIASNVFHDHPDAYDTGSRYTVTVSPLRQVLTERASLVFWLLMGAAGLVLLIACANVANLTLMKGIEREREMLVRTALGASRWRLRRLLLVENLTLALFGGALGVLVAFGGLRMLVAFAAQFTPRADEIHIDAVVLGVSLATSVAAALALSLVPRIGGEGALAAPLAAAGRRTTLGWGRRRFQQALVVAQLALCVVLLTGAGLLVRTLAGLESVETGVRVDHVLTLDLPVEGSLETFVSGAAARLATYERIRDRVAGLPGVKATALALTAPLRRTILTLDIKAEDRPVPPGEPVPHAQLKTVDPNYFTVAGIPLLAGRGFESTDRGGAPLVVVLSQTSAKELFGKRDPIGRHVAWTGEVLKFTPISDAWRTVVGVVGDTRDDGLAHDPTPTVFEPFAQGLMIGGTLVVRTAGDPGLIRPAVTRAIREISPRQMIEHVETLAQIRDASVAARRLNALFVASFGALAMVIAMVGVAGVLGFSVKARTAEIGIRMSFGADAWRVQRMVLREGGVLLAAGLTVGLLGALVGTRLLRGLLFGITPHDPTTLAIVAFVLGTVGVAACWLPAARAARVDPAIALRAE